jgi:hypothetical protein
VNLVGNQWEKNLISIQQSVEETKYDHMPNAKDFAKFDMKCKKQPQI